MYNASLHSVYLLSYTHTKYLLLFNGVSLQSGVQQLTELPEWTKHASTVHCTVQLYSTTIVLLSTAVLLLLWYSSGAVQLYSVQLMHDLSTLGAQLIAGLLTGEMHQFNNSKINILAL